MILTLASAKYIYKNIIKSCYYYNKPIDNKLSNNI